MNENEIAGLVNAWADGFEKEDPRVAIPAAKKLVATVLVDLHRIADALERLAASKAS